MKSYKLIIISLLLVLCFSTAVTANSQVNDANMEPTVFESTKITTVGGVNTSYNQHNDIIGASLDYENEAQPSAIMDVQGNSFTDIQNAINSASSGDTINLGGKNYTGNSAINIPNSLTSLIISGGDVGVMSKLDAQNTSQIINIGNINTHINVEVVFKNIKFINSIGALFANCNKITIINCSFENGSSILSSASLGNGGAIAMYRGLLNISSCNFTDNYASSLGGAIYAQGDLKVDNSNFINNSAENYGSAIYNFGKMNLTYSTFDETNSKGFASIYLDKDGNKTVWLEKNVVVSNLIPIYNNNSMIISPTVLTVFDNKTYFRQINESMLLWGHLYDDNYNTIGSNIPIILNIVGMKDYDIPASFDVYRPWDFDTPKVNLNKTGKFSVIGRYAGANNTELFKGRILVYLFNANLDISKIVDKTVVNYNDTVVWTIKVTNKGPDDAVNVTVKDLIPEGLVVISANVDKGNYSIYGDVLTWSIRSLDKREVVFMNLTTKAVKAGNITNMVNVSSVGIDYRIYNNHANNTTYVKSADLEINIVPDKEEITIEDMVVWIITVTNKGPDVAENVVAFDKLPEGLELISYDSSKGIVNDNDVLTWTIGNLTSGESVTLVLTTKTLVPGVITHNVNVTSNTYDPILSNNFASANITVKDSVGPVPPTPDHDNKTKIEVSKQSSLLPTGNPIAIVVLALLCLLGARLKRKD